LPRRRPQGEKNEKDQRDHAEKSESKFRRHPAGSIESHTLTLISNSRQWIDIQKTKRCDKFAPLRPSRPAAHRTSAGVAGSHRFIAYRIGGGNGAARWLGNIKLRR
jgi:hypothetical protein